MWPKDLCISDNLLVAPRIYLQRYPKSLRRSSRSVQTCHMQVHVLHSSLIHGISGILRSLLNSWSDFSKQLRTLCFLLHHFFSAVDLLSVNSLSQQNALTQPEFPFLPNNWSTPTFRSSTPALTGANSQVFLACLYVFQPTAILSQSGETTPTPHTVAGSKVLDREGPCTVKSSKPTFTF